MIMDVVVCEWLGMEFIEMIDKGNGYKLEYYWYWWGIFVWFYLYIIGYVKVGDDWMIV